MNSRKPFSPELSRRQLLIAGTGLAAANLYAAKGELSDEALKGESLFRDIVTYSSMGEHRTATDVDVKTSKWLASELRRAGYDVRLVPFQHQQFFTKAIELKVDGKPVKGFPMWWPRPTGSKPVTGPLAPADPNSPGSLTGKIALVKIPEVPGTSILPGNIVHQVIEPVQKSGALGIVAIILSPTGEIVEQNAMSGLAKWSVPILIVGQSDEALLDQAAARSASCTLLLDGQYKDKAEAYEVIGKLNRGKKLVVVTTPSSGWFHCAGERGPGIALWLGLARWAEHQKSDLSYEFVASSGHELHGAGIEEFMKREPPPRENVLCWLHLGAGIATYDYKKTDHGLEKQSNASHLRRLFSVQRFAPILREAFADLPDLKPIVADRPRGEMVLMAEKGYPYFGFAGGNVFHHMPGDLPERITGPELLEPVGRDLINAFKMIQSQEMA